MLEIINEQLKIKCNEFGFYFIDNNNISKNFQWKDGLHLNSNGKFLSCVNNFYSKKEPSAHVLETDISENIITDVCPSPGNSPETSDTSDIQNHVTSNLNIQTTH